MIGKEEWDTLKESFLFTKCFLHTIVTAIFTASAMLITPFVIIERGFRMQIIFSLFWSFNL